MYLTLWPRWKCGRMGYADCTQFSAPRFAAGPRYHSDPRINHERQHHGRHRGHCGIHRQHVQRRFSAGEHRKGEESACRHVCRDHRRRGLGSGGTLAQVSRRRARTRRRADTGHRHDRRAGDGGAHQRHLRACARLRRRAVHHACAPERRDRRCAARELQRPTRRRPRIHRGLPRGRRSRRQYRHRHDQWPLSARLSCDRHARTLFGTGGARRNCTMPTSRPSSRLSASRPRCRAVSGAISAR